MTPTLHTGDVIKVRQGSMELYRVQRQYLLRHWWPGLLYIGNAQHGDNPARYADATRVYPGPVTIDGVPCRIEMGAVNGRPRVVA